MKLKFWPLPSVMVWPLPATTCQTKVWVSAVPGSVKLPVRLTRLPSLTLWFAPPSTFWGFTLATSTLMASLSVPPSSSLTSTLTSSLAKLSAQVQLKLPALTLKV